MSDLVLVELFGRFQMSAGGRRIEGIHSARLESLVAYLVLHSDRPIARGQLAAMLWPESSDAQALTNLRRELHLLRRALPEPDELILLEHRAVQWRPDGPFRSDVADFEAAVVRGRDGDAQGFEDALRLYDGPLLPTCYDDWIGPERERLSGLQLEASERLVADLEDRREYRRAMGLLRRMIELDPLREANYQSLMRIAALAGDRSAGLQAYHAGVTSLRRELGVEPDAETRAAYQRLLALDSSAAADRSPTPAAPAASGGRLLGSANQPLVGRQAEWASMVDVWKTVAHGPSRLIEIRGEAGIGKTRVLEELVRWCRAQGFTAAYTKSYAAEGALAYAPIADWLRSESIRGCLDELEPVWLIELARVLPELLSEHPDLPKPAPMTESWQRKSLFEAIARAVRAVSKPLLLVLDDAQWADGETLEWIHYFLREESSSQILFAAGIRSDEERSSRPLTALLVDLLGHDQLSAVDLPALSEDETALLANQLLGADAADELLARIYQETEGHPLYVMEVARGGLATLDRTTDLDPSISRLPPRILAAIGSRLEQLSEEATEALEVAATIGRAFRFEVLEGSSDLEEAALVRALDELWQRQIVREQGLNTYDFGHDRIRDAAYARIGPRRRRLLHRRVAQTLELQNAADLDTVSAQIAAHYESAGLPARAIEWFERAADVARRVSANVEAVRYLSRAIRLIAALPPSLQRDRDELRLQIALAPPTVASRGYASGDFAVAVDRARVLAATVHDARSEGLALNGLAAAQIVHGEVRRSLETGRASVERVDGYPELVTACELNYAGSMSTLGMQDQAVEYFERAVRAYLPGRSTMAIGFEPGAFAMSWESHALWLWGAPHRAVERQHEAMELASTRGPHSLALANAYGAVLFQYLGDVDEMSARAEAAIDLCERYGFAYYGEWGRILLAWRDRTTPGSDSVARIETALESLRSIGAEVRRPYYLALLAETHRAAGDTRRARSILDAAVATANANEDVYWLPDVLRSIAEIGPESSRETTLRSALALARSQGSRSLALRVAMSLARHTQDATDEVRAALSDMPEIRAVRGGARSRDDARDDRNGLDERLKIRSNARTIDPRTLFERSVIEPAAITPRRGRKRRDMTTETRPNLRIDESALEGLKATFRGDIIGTEDPAYEDARRVQNGMIDRRPTLIVRPADVADVISAIGFGRDQGLDIAVRSGGHSAPGFGTVDDGLVIDLSRMRGVRVDPEMRTARVEGGALLGDVDHATHAFGLAVPAGIISNTGVGGLTLGGGLGHLTRKLGLTIDNLLEADVVLASGELVTASATSNPDLFWAIRGGGGNFGVVTSFLFRLHPVSTVVAGPTLYALEDAAAVLSWWQDFIAQAPEELNGFFAFLTVPPAAPFPEELQMRKVCGIVWTYSGPVEKADEVFAPIKAFGSPLLYGVQPLPLPAWQAAFDGLYPKGAQMYWRAEFMNELSDEAIAVEVKHGAVPTVQSTSHIYPVDGAVHRVGPGETAWNQRDVRFAQVVLGADGDPANAAMIRDWAVAFGDAIKPFSAGGAYMNFTQDEGQERVRATYRDNYERLARIKSRYDPKNLFHLNQNIRPG